MTATDTRPTFALRLRYVGKPAEAAIHALRALLKSFCHRGFICIDAKEEAHVDAPDEGAHK
jgi:hypothetical protein